MLWGEGASHQPGNRGSCLWELPNSKAEVSGCAGRVNLCTCSLYSIHSSACSDLSGYQGLQATPDSTNSHIPGYSDIHILPNEPEKCKGQRYHSIQMRACKPGRQPEVVRTATWHCLQQVALKRNITHLFTNSSHLFFYYPAETGQTFHVCARTPTGCILWAVLTTYVSFAMSLTTYWIHRDQHLYSSLLLATQTQQKVQS